MREQRLAGSNLTCTQSRQQILNKSVCNRLFLNSRYTFEAMSELPVKPDNHVGLFSVSQSIITVGRKLQAML